MNPYDLFKPYSPEIHGDLEKYLEKHQGGDADNLFYSYEYFIVMRDKGFIIPYMAGVRVNQSPIPDIYYVVNSAFMLESSGRGRENMSCVGAPEGVYDPSEVLRNKTWSIHGLNISSSKK